MRQIKISALAATVFLAGSLTLDAAWTTKRLTNQDSSKYNPKIAVSGSNIYVVWEAALPDYQYPLYFKRSDDGGTTWKSARKLTAPDEGASNPAIAAYGPSVYVVWESGYGLAFRKSIDDGATWSAISFLPATFSGQSHPDIAVSGPNVYVVWNQWDGDEWGSEEIYITRSTNSGRTWTDPENITTEAAAEDDIDPAVAASGNYVYVVWQRDDSSGDVVFQKSADKGVTWAAALVNLSNTPAGNTVSPDIAALGAKVHAVWNEYKEGAVYYIRSINYAATWPSPRKLTGSSYKSGSPAVAAKTNGLGLVYETYVTADLEIDVKRSVNYGSSFTSTRLTQNAGSSREPDVALSSTHIFAVWTDDTPGRDEIYVKFSPLE